MLDKNKTPKYTYWLVPQTTSAMLSELEIVPEYRPRISQATLYWKSFQHHSSRFSIHNNSKVKKRKSKNAKNMMCKIVETQTWCEISWHGGAIWWQLLNVKCVFGFSAEAHKHRKRSVSFHGPRWTAPLHGVGRVLDGCGTAQRLPNRDVPLPQLPQREQRQNQRDKDWTTAGNWPLHRRRRYRGKDKL